MAEGLCNGLDEEEKTRGGCRARPPTLPQLVRSDTDAAAAAGFRNAWVSGTLGANYGDAVQIAQSRKRAGVAACEGAATTGLELVRDDSGLDVVLVAVGGGAMASSVGYAVRRLAEHVEVIGIQSVAAPAMALSWRQRTVVETGRIETIADGAGS